jgi:glycosyltransferase involved in cell wall biosynthesis
VAAALDAMTSARLPIPTAVESRPITRTETKAPVVMLLVTNIGVGGAERHTVQLAKLLAGRFDVVLGYLKADQDAATRLRPNGLKSVACLDVKKRIDWGAVKRLAQLITTSEVDVVLCANAFPLLYVQLARWICRRRFEVVEIYHTTLVTDLAARLKLLIYRPLFWLSAHLVFVCDTQRRHCLKRGIWARRVTVIHNGIDIHHFSNALPKSNVTVRSKYGFEANDRVVGLCAVFRPEKAHGDLLQAIYRLKEAGICWKVLLIGDGPTRPAIEAEISRLGLSDDVRITGFVDDVRGAISACDVMVLVSVAVETFSIAALEAMALGKPMIMSDVGGAAELIRPGIDGWLFPPGDIEKLVALLTTMTDESRCTAMGAAARERVEKHFSQETMLDHYAALLNQLAGRTRSQGGNAQ